MTTATICLTVVSTAVSFQEVGIRRTLAPSRRIVKPRNQTTHTSSTGQTTTPRLNVNLGIIGVKDNPRTRVPGRDGHVQGLGDQVRAHVVGDGVADHLPGVQVNDRRQIGPPLPSLDIRVGVGPGRPASLSAGGFPWRLVGSGAGAVTLMRSVSSPRPSNRACGSPAHGSPTPFTGGVRPEPARPGWAWVRRRFH